MVNITFRSDSVAVTLQTGVTDEVITKSLSANKKASHYYKNDLDKEIAKSR